MTGAPPATHDGRSAGGPADGPPAGPVGMRIRRIEDPRLLAGRGAFLDDLEVTGMVEAAILRSPLAHARIRAIDVEAARAMPGVLDVLTGAELAEHVQPQPVIYRIPADQRPTDALAMAVDRVRWVGQPVAAVVATDRYRAEDALERIEVDYEELPVVADAERAIAPDAPRLYDDWPDNVVGTRNYDKGDVADAFARADVVVRQRFKLARMLGCPLETRGCLASWDPVTDELEIWLGTQAPHLARDLLAETLSLPSHKIRVRVPDLGGGFGVKFDFYAEEVIAALLSRRVGRPVKYVEDRLESFTASAQSREVLVDAELAVDGEGRMLGLRGRVLGVLGGAMGTVGVGPAHGCAAAMAQGYRIPAARIEFVGVATNRAPMGSYRGWGQPEGNFVIERLIALAARELGMDANELRRRNVPAPDEFPFDTEIVYRLDNGRYADCIDLADAAIRELRWPERRDAARAEGRSVGIGTAFYIEGTAFGPSRALNRYGLSQGGFDVSVVRLDTTGRVIVLTSLNAMGQGVQTALAQVAAQTLGVAVEDVTVVAGESTDLPYTGYGTGGSRGAAVGGAALMTAARELREKVKRIAAHQLEADPDDLVIEDGRIFVRGVPGRHVTMADVGDAAYRRLDGALPESESPTLEARHVFDPDDQAWAYGEAAFLVEVDRETGVVDVLDCLFTHDCGTIVNPTIVEGQIHGAVAQGIGQTLYEELVYDDEGQLLTATFADYLMPTAAELPRVAMREMHTPSPLIPGGMKGVGEAGVIPTPAALANAVEDAVADLGVRIGQLPITPPRLLELIDAAEGRDP